MALFDGTLWAKPSPLKGA